MDYSQTVLLFVCNCSFYFSIYEGCLFQSNIKIHSTTLISNSLQNYSYVCTVDTDDFDPIKLSKRKYQVRGNIILQDIPCAKVLNYDSVKLTQVFNKLISIHKILTLQPYKGKNSHSVDWIENFNNGIFYNRCTLNRFILIFASISNSISFKLA